MMTPQSILRLMNVMTQKHTCRFPVLFALAALLICVLNSCNQESGKEFSGTGKYKLEVTDSVTFDRLSQLSLLDYHAEKKELLIYDSQLGEILVINETGELISSFNPFVEGPLYMGDESFGWRFYGDDQILGYGRVYFYLFNRGSDQVERYDYPTEVESWWLLDYDPKMIFTFPNQGQLETMAIIPGVAAPKFNSKAYQDSTKMIYTMNLATGENRAVFRKPAHSVYRTLGKYIDRGWPLLAHGKDHYFAMTYSADSNVYIMDAIKDEVVNTIPLPGAHQPLYETVPFEARGRPDLMKINSSMVSTGDAFVLRSLNVIPESVKRQIRATEEGRWWESDAYKEASRKYIKHQSLLFNKDGYLGEVDSNIGKVNFDKISTDQGFFWMHRRYEDERDYHTFLKVQVVKTD